MWNQASELRQSKVNKITPLRVVTQSAATIPVKRLHDLFSYIYWVRLQSALHYGGSSGSVCLFMLNREFGTNQLYVYCYEQTLQITLNRM